MNIRVNSTKKGDSRLEYVMTYVPGQLEKTRKFEFPAVIENLDAEGMLHAISQLSLRPEVYGLLEKLFPAFAQTKDLADILDRYTDEWGHIPLDWRHVGTYWHHQDCLAVDYRKREYFFTAENSFYSMYREAFHDNWYQREVHHGSGIPAETFHEFAANDIPSILSPCTSVFVAEEDYKPICRQLKKLCRILEKHLDELLFIFLPTAAPYEIYLVGLFREEADLYPEETFYPDMKHDPTLFK